MFGKYFATSYLKYMNKIMFRVKQHFQQYHGGQFYQWKKLEYQEKTTDMMVVIDKLYNKMFYRLSLVMSRI